VNVGAVCTPARLFLQRNVHRLVHSHVASDAEPTSRWCHTRRIWKCLVKIVCSSDSSWAIAEVKYRGECGVRVQPSRDTIFRLVKRFQETGIACDERTEGRRHGLCVSTERLVEVVTRRSWERTDVCHNRWGLKRQCEAKIC